MNRGNKTLAFPCQDQTTWFYGMTLREYYAAKVVPGIIERMGLGSVDLRSETIKAAA